jgi:hypothetical protein
MYLESLSRVCWFFCTFQLEGKINTILFAALMPFLSPYLVFSSFTFPSFKLPLHHSGPQRAGKCWSLTKGLGWLVLVDVVHGIESTTSPVYISNHSERPLNQHMVVLQSSLCTCVLLFSNEQAGAIGGDGSDFDTSSPLAGLGYGLPISRAYARYYKGLCSIHGASSFCSITN